MKYIFLFVLMVLSLSYVCAQGGWSLQTNPLGFGESAMIGKIQYVSQNEAWMSAGNGQLLHTTNGGDAWVAVQLDQVDTLSSLSDPALSLSFVNATTGWTIRTRNSLEQPAGVRVYKTTTGGSTWSKHVIAGWDMGVSVQFVDVTTGWIVVTNASITAGAILKTTDGGTTWNPIVLLSTTLGLPFFATATSGWVMPVDPAGMTTDSIVRTTDGGATWQSPWGTGAQVRLNAIHFPDASNGWVVGNGGVILHTTNGGTTWTYVSNAGINSTYDSKTVFFLNANIGWIGTKTNLTNAPVVLHTTDGGTSWSMQSTPLTDQSGHNSIFSVHFFDAQHGGLTADYGRICNTSTGGVSAVGDVQDGLPAQFALQQNFPNPFNPSTTIRYDILQSGHVSLVLCDLLGRRVDVLVDQVQQAGQYSVPFDAAQLSAGVYLYTLRTGTFIATRKLVLIK
jgi:photosystem II stability/assembly factor-like uncharacterized protein